MGDDKNKPKTKPDRVGVGSALACVTTLVVFALWRLAATYDFATGAEEWEWLAFETFAMFITYPVFAMMVTGVGWLLVHKGNGARSLSVLASVGAALAYGIGLWLLGLFDFIEDAPLASAPVSILVLVIAGAAGGLLGHAGWFPDDAE